MSGTRAISTTSRRELSSSFFFPLQGKAPKVIHAILTETLACFLPGRAKDLSAPLYNRIAATGFVVLRFLSDMKGNCEICSNNYHVEAFLGPIQINPLLWPVTSGVCVRHICQM